MRATIPSTWDLFHHPKLGDGGGLESQQVQRRRSGQERQVRCDLVNDGRGRDGFCQAGQSTGDDGRHGDDRADNHRADLERTPFVDRLCPEEGNAHEYRHPQGDEFVDIHLDEIDRFPRLAGPESGYEEEQEEDGGEKDFLDERRHDRFLNYNLKE